MREQQQDVLVIGGGHNGLVCAAYLAAAGLKVRVLERRHIVGGAAVTEEFHPGFRNSVASYTVSLLNPAVIRDLRLAEHGLRVVERPYANFLPLPDGRSFRLGGGHTEAEIAKFAPGDVPRWADRADGFMGRKLLGLARNSDFEIVELETWADTHRRFDEDSVGWKVARGVLAATADDAQLAARAAAWVAGLRKQADDGRFLFTVTDVALVLRRPE